ncbi:MAG: membrane protein insertase YidC [Elusimicrobiota bacterium]|jgi:YidC/Oxa1 family membrane protein insertase|nr:membrane protein insertase YidC [Elusimicrobiota bacterium]
MQYLETALRNVFEYFYIISNSYGISIIFLSIAVTGFLTPFYYLTGILEKREKNTRERLDPFIERINKIKDPQIRHKHMQKLYKSFKYSPIYSLRSLSSLLIQIPFFIAAYEMLKHFEGLRGISFLFIKDLGEPDKILGGVNLLPVMMTLINFIAAIFMTWNAGGGSRETEKERKQSYIIAVFFLVLLYTSPAGLVLYWTFNNFINLIRYFIIWNKENSVCEIVGAVGKKIKDFINKDELSVFLLFCALYFSINLFSFGAYTRNNSNILIMLLIPFYLALLLKTARFIKENFSKNKSFIIKISIVIICYIVSFAVYQYEKTHYLFAVLILLAAYQYKKIKFYPLKDYLKISMLSVTVMLFPSILYFKSNAVYFVGNDIFFYFLALIFFAACLPLITYFLNQTSLNKISIFSVSFIISAMFLPLIRESVGYAGETSIDFVLFFLIVLFIIWLFDKYKKIIIIFFLCAALYAAFSGLKINSDSNERQSSNINPTTNIPKELIDMDMKDTPSIYLFMHDGFPPKELAQYLGLDYSQLDEIFSQNDFVVYDVYSIGYYTNVSMTSVFDIKDHRIDEVFIDEQRGRQIFAGDNFVNLLLRQKGYMTAVAGEDDPSAFDKNLFVYGLTSGKGEMQNQVLLGIMQGRLNTMLLKYRREGSPAMQVAEFAKKNAGKDKIFAWGSAGPDHSSLSLDLSNELKVWSVKYYNAISDFRKEIDIMIKENPNAIIIFMSDHGPWMLGNPRNDYANVLDKDINSLYFRDKYGAEMAIRWPDKKRASKYDKEFYITQDLFPIVLAYLYDSKIPLKYKIKNTDVRIKDYKFDKGKLYPHFY